MFKIVLSKHPTFENIKPHYLEAIHKLCELINQCKKNYNLKVHSVFIRGSCVHGDENLHSDLDFVVLLDSQSLDVIRRFEFTLESLIAMFVFSFAIDIKVYGVNQKDCFVEPAVLLDKKLNFILKRHLNFDLLANGVLHQGKALKNPANTFNSPLDFIQNGCVVWLHDIDQLSTTIPAPETFKQYIYLVIKKIVKLATLIKFDPAHGFVASLPNCLIYCNAYYLPFKETLCLLQHFIEQKIELSILLITSLERFVDHVIVQAKLHYRTILPDEEIPHCKFKLSDYYQALFIQNNTHIDLVVEPWISAIKEVEQRYLLYLGADLHSIYLRGSVAHGTAIPYQSDIDTFVVIMRPVTLADKQWAIKQKISLCKQFPFAYDVDLDFIFIDDVLLSDSNQSTEKLIFNNRFDIKTQSICLSGKNLENKIPPMLPDANTANLLLPCMQEIYRMVFQGIQNNYSAQFKKQWCRWFMKQFLRYFFLMIMPKVGFFTRDLSLCYKHAVVFYPEFEAQLKLAFDLAVRPISNTEKLYKHFDFLMLALNSNLNNNVILCNHA